MGPGLRDDEPEVRGFRVEHLQIVLLDIAIPGLSRMESQRRMKTLCRGTCVVTTSPIEAMETARPTLALEPSLSLRASGTRKSRHELSVMDGGRPTENLRGKTCENAVVA